MPVQLNVTRGYNFVEEPLTPGKLNLLGVPQVSIPDNSIPPEVLNIPAIVAALKPQLAAANLLPWGHMPPEQWASSPIVVPAGSRLGIGWPWSLAAVGGAGASAARALGTPTGATTTAWTTEVRGSVGMTSADLITPLPPSITNQTANKTITFSAYIQNLAGGPTISPSLVISTAATVGGALSVVSGPLAPSTTIAPGEWQRLSWTLDTAALPNWANGAELAIRLGSYLDDTSKAVKITQAQLEIGAVATAWIHSAPDLPEGKPSYMANQRVAARAYPTLVGRAALTEGTPDLFQLGAGLQLVGNELRVNVSGGSVIARSQTGFTFNNSTTEQTMVTFAPVAGDILGGDTLELLALIRVANTSGVSVSFTPRIKEAGTILCDFGSLAATTANTTNFWLKARLTYETNGAFIDLKNILGSCEHHPGTGAGNFATPALRGTWNTKATVGPGAITVTMQASAAQALAVCTLMDFQLTRYRP